GLMSVEKINLLPFRRADSFPYEAPGYANSRHEVSGPHQVCNGNGPRADLNQNELSRSLISQDFLPRSGTNRPGELAAPVGLAGLGPGAGDGAGRAGETHIELVHGASLGGHGAKISRSPNHFGVDSNRMSGFKGLGPSLVAP